MCRTTLIQSALESSDPRASNGGSNVRIRPLGVDLITFEMAELPKNMLFSSTFLSIPNPITWESDNYFKSHEVDPKWSDFDVLPTIRCARIRAFQRTSNQRRSTQL